MQMGFSYNCLDGYSILIIDDDLLIQQSIYQMLADSTAEYLSAPNAEIGIKLAHKKQPDIILLDWNMPNMSGIDALRLLKANEQTRQIPVVMMTAFSKSSQHAFNALSIGADDFLRKPFEKPELIGRLCAIRRLYDAKAKIQRQNTRLEKLAHEKSKLLSIISHDLKTPLNNIEGLVHLVKNELNQALDNTNSKQYLDMITKITTQERVTINQVLEIYEYEKSSLQNVQTIDWIPFITQVLDSYLHNSKNIRIHFQANRSKLVSQTSPIYIKKIIDNLLSNAIKYSFPNSSIQVILENHQKYIYLSIKDQGQGFHPDELEKVFKEFGKFSAQPTGGESSTGIGLYIVKSIIDRLGGSIQVKSTYSKGSEFMVLIPCTTDAQSQQSIAQ
ncbi:MAG: hybrid sensor histidine kinase/response regulator [Flammeovirgaceae bacterium]